MNLSYRMLPENLVFIGLSRGTTLKQNQCKKYKIKSDMPFLLYKLVYKFQMICFWEA